MNTPQSYMPTEQNSVNPAQTNMLTSFVREIDAAAVLNFFPEEMWRIILANVQDANDYLRICGASPLFKNLLSAQKVPVLLTAVVQILLRRRESWMWDPNHWNPEEAEDDPRLHLNHIVAFREVCRDWKQAVDRALHNLPYHFQFPKELDKLDYQFYSQVFYKYTELFQNESQLTAFDRYHHDSHFATGTNPFITRAVEIRLPFGIPERPCFIPACLDMLRKYGKHVRHLTIRDMGSINRLTAKQFSYFLKDVLEQVPNLVSLRYDIRNFYSFCEPLDCQFPPLKKLEFFDQVGLPFRIVEAHLQAAKLTLIAVTFHKETFLDDEKAFKEFCQMSDSVSKLRIDFCSDKMYWDGIFAKMETYFADSLTTLYVSLPHTGLFVKSKQLRLPKLKTLHFELEEACSLDFLLGMTKDLEYLSIKLKSPLNYQEMKCVQSKERKLKVYHAAHSEKLYLCNI